MAKDELQDRLLAGGCLVNTDTLVSGGAHWIVVWKYSTLEFAFQKHPFSISLAFLRKLDVV